MAKDILKEAIADAKAVREVALANAKAALEEAFTPKLQSMLSAKLSEELDEDMYDEDDMDEGMYDEDDMDEGMHDEDDMDEVYHDEDDMDEGMHDEDDMDEGMHDEDDMDEEIDLEELLNELELDEDEEVLDEKEDELEEGAGTAYPNYTADEHQKVYHSADDINRGLNESEEFDLDALLNEINSLEEEDVNEGHCYDEDGKPMPEAHCYEEGVTEGKKDEDDMDEGKDKKEKVEESTGCKSLRDKLIESQSAYAAIKSELNEVNLLNSKLLYVNRIFKANNLDEAQKLRVVETLDNASNVKEAKLIYETIKDTFNVAKSKKASFKNKTKSLKEGIGMASKAAGTSTAPKKEVISESNDMMKRFQKLANITINE